MARLKSPRMAGRVGQENPPDGLQSACLHPGSLPLLCGFRTLGEGNLRMREEESSPKVTWSMRLELSSDARAGSFPLQHPKFTRDGINQEIESGS